MSTQTASDVEVEHDTDEEEQVDEAATDNVGDPSVEINVQELINEIEQEASGTAGPGADARRRLDEIMERKRIEREISDYDDF